MKWGGFASTPSQAATGPSTTPTFDSLIKRASRFAKTDRPTTISEDKAPPPPEEPHKPFNHEFDEPARFVETQTSASPQANKASPVKHQSLLTMQREGKRLSKKQKALLQAAAISRTPLPNTEEKTLAEAKEKDAKVESEPRMETDEEKKQFQNKVWDLVKGKWF